MMARTTLARRVIAGALAATWLAAAPPAWACLSCGCGGSSASTDLGAVGGAASIFSLGHRFLLQQGVSFRAITGSFNELGAWSPVPLGGTMTTLQGTFGLRFFPSPDSSIGLTLPVVGNALDKAAWGPFGSVTPTDLPLTMGGALGDVALQGSYKVWESGPFAVGAWGGMVMPTGQATGDPAGLTGAGLWNAQTGLSGIVQLADWELIANLGAQIPLGGGGDQTVFALGPAALYQLQVDYLPFDGWRFGLGLNGYLGQASTGAGETQQWSAKTKVLPSVAYQWSFTQGLRLAAGLDPTALGANSMTDATFYLVLFQFL